VFVAGAVVQWLRDELGFIEKSQDIEKLAASVLDSGDVFWSRPSRLGAPTGTRMHEEP